MIILKLINYIVLKASVFLNWFLGGFDSLLNALVVFCLINFIIDLVLSILKDKHFRRIEYQGLLKKSLILTLIGLAHILDLYIVVEGGNSIRNAVIFYYLSIEGFNLLKKANTLGLPVPQKLKQILKQQKNS